jgi:hypothetical protein
VKWRDYSETISNEDSPIISSLLLLVEEIELTEAEEEKMK